MKNIYIVIGAVVVLIILFAGIWIGSGFQAGPDLTNFTQCLKQKKALFYGAFWCPHCQATKTLFGKAESELPYIECSSTDGKSQLQICIDKKITGYPTWEFADGSRLTGELSLQTLSDKTSCPLPTQTATSTTTNINATSTAN